MQVKKLNAPQCNKSFLISAKGVVNDLTDVKSKPRNAEDKTQNSSEVCSNCGREIGKLEKSYIYENQIVCWECYERLKGIKEHTAFSQSVINIGTRVANNLLSTATPAKSVGESHRGKAISSLVLGIISTIFFYIPVGWLAMAITGLCLGIAAKRGMKISGNQDNSGKATAGIVLGIIATILAGLFTIGIATE